MPDLRFPLRRMNGLLASAFLALAMACTGGGGGGGNPNVAPAFAAQPQSLTVTAPATATFSVSATGTPAPTYQWRKNGVDIAGAASSSFTTPATSLPDSGSQFTVFLSNAAGSATSSAAVLTVYTVPAITGQPASQTVTAPAAATFTVTATGTPAPAYQWRKNGVDIPGATGSSYTTPASGLADSGSLFTVFVSNVAGNVTSSPATLTVNTAPAITSQPAGQTVTAPASATFSVTATGSPAPTYQWRKNGVDLPGATGSSYTTPATTLADSGSQFTALVSNSVGSLATSPATLTVNTLPLITLQPLSQAVTAPATATFSVTATGSPAPTYQWRKNGVDIPGATGSSHTTPATLLADNGSLFTVLATNVAGTALSSAATLTVSAAPTPPSITAQPVSVTVTAPATASFSVVATGTAPLAYQWRKNGVDIPGATSSAYTTPATGLADNGSLFTVFVSNAAGNLLSSAATLTVNTVPAITVQPVNQSVTVPAAATFTVTATGSPAPGYQWRKNGVDIPGATSSAYTTPATVLGDSGSLFTVFVSNAFGSVLSNAATLTVNPPGALDLWIDGLYLTQATQKLDMSVPLVKDRPGYLRVFPRASASNSATPQVRVRIYNGSAVLQSTLLISAPGASVSTAAPNESSLSNSWNVAIPGSLIQPGYTLLADLDPTNVIAEGNEANNSYPVSGTPQALNVHTLNPFRVTFWAVQTGDGRVGAVDAGLITNFTSLLEKIWPTDPSIDRAYGGTWTTSVASLVSGGGGWSTTLSELNAKRTADGVSNRYYYGVVNPNYGSGVAGLGYVGWPVAIGWDKFAGYSDSGQYPGVYAHEVGHNFNRSHAPCGGVGSPDPSYPYPGGLIGVWGLDVAAVSLKDPASWTDIMGYCDFVWVSDYNYKAVLSYRESSGLSVVPAAGDTKPGRSLLLWGRMEDGIPILEPAFQLERPALPPEPGDQLLEGFDARGQRVLSVSFNLTEVGCPDPGRARSFAFSLPITPEDEGRLVELRWSKAGALMARQVGNAQSRRQPMAPAQEPALQGLMDGRTRLIWDGQAHPMMMVRDRSTGLVIGFGRGGDFRFSTDTEELEVHLSDGVSSRPMLITRPRMGD